MNYPKTPLFSNNNNKSNTTKSIKCDTLYNDDIIMTSGFIIGLNDPIEDTEISNKAYVDLLSYSSYLSSDIPVDVTKSVGLPGVSSHFARADHKHDISTAAPSISLSATTTNTEGTSTTLSRSDHLHTITTGIPSQQTITTASTGTSTNLARADHIHSFSTTVPSTIGVFTRTAGVWTQQQKLIGTGYVSTPNGVGQGVCVSLYQDTLAVGGDLDNGITGASWIFTRSAGVWTQVGSKLVGTGASGFQNQGHSLSLYGDLLAVGGYNASSTWLFALNNGTWTQQGSKLVGTGSSGNAHQGTSVSLQQNTLAIGGNTDSLNAGAIWMFLPNTLMARGTVVSSTQNFDVKVKYMGTLASGLSLFLVYTFYGSGGTVSTYNVPLYNYQIIKLF